MFEDDLSDDNDILFSKDKYNDLYKNQLDLSDFENPRSPIKKESISLSYDNKNILDSPSNEKK